MLFEQSCLLRNRPNEKLAGEVSSTGWQDHWYDISVNSDQAARRALEVFRKGHALERSAPVARCLPYWKDNDSRLAANLEGWYPGKDGLLFNLYRSPVSIPFSHRKRIQGDMIKTACEDLFFLWKPGFVQGTLQSNLGFCRLAHLIRLFSTLIPEEEYLGSRQGAEVTACFESYWPAIEELWRKNAEKNPKSLYWKGKRG
jgi:hypothetical protein